MSGGVNVTDPAVSLRPNEVRDCLNARLLLRGFERWPGAENLPAHGVVTDFFRGEFHHSEVDGTDHLFTVFGGKLYEINKSTGAKTELYDMTGSGEAWGGSHFGTFFCANGSSVVKVEGSTAYQVGITPPTGVTAAGATSGGSLADGTYKLYAAYARRVSGVNVLYSTGQSIADVVISGGGGNGKITISNFANSGDGQVGNKVIFMTDAGGSTYYQYHQTEDNTTTTFDIVDASNKQTAITYTAYSQPSARPGNFTFLFAHNNRLWGIIGNVLYYSMKATPTNTYNLERFRPLDYIKYPYQLTGIFAVGKHLCLNTAENGVIVQPLADVTAPYEHLEQRQSFKYMRTVGDWRGGKIGVTNDRVGFFDPTTMQFEEWDYGKNIRPALTQIWANATSDFQPCGITYRRADRIEYQLSFRDTRVGSYNNNRTYALNLSRTTFLDAENFKAPWEIVGRGFNYVCVDGDNTLFMAQSRDSAGTVYKEDSTSTTEVGIYDDDGSYISTAQNMRMWVTTRTVLKNLFTKQVIDNIRGLYRIAAPITVGVYIADDSSKSVTQEISLADAAMEESLWGTMVWGDNWAGEDEQMDEIKIYDGVHGYTWYLKLSQTGDDSDCVVTQLDVLLKNATGRGI